MGTLVCYSIKQLGSQISWLSQGNKKMESGNTVLLLGQQSTPTAGPLLGRAGAYFRPESLVQDWRWRYKETHGLNDPDGWVRSSMGSCYREQKFEAHLFILGTLKQIYLFIWICWFSNKNLGAASRHCLGPVVNSRKWSFIQSLNKRKILIRRIAVSIVKLLVRTVSITLHRKSFSWVEFSPSLNIRNSWLAFTMNNKSHN